MSEQTASATGCKSCGGLFTVLIDGHCAACWGVARIFELERQLAEVQYERDQALNNADEALQERWRKRHDATLHQLAEAQGERNELQQWVHDLQAGMYINCVYCGHRYGPDDKVPATMADALKEHIEQCPKHPMSALKVERDEAWGKIEAALKWADDYLNDITRSITELHVILGESE